MILGIRIDNFLTFSNGVEFSASANMHIKKFADNVCNNGNFNILKSACVYGSNNSGKTCFVRAINSIRNVLLGQAAEMPCNLFRYDKTCSLGVTFTAKSRVFSYDFKYDSSMVNGYKKGFVFECLKELTIDKHKNAYSKELFMRDVDNGVYRFRENDELRAILSSVSSDNILIYTINAARYPVLDEYKRILRRFASDLDIIDMNNIPIGKTIDALKNNRDIREKTVELIKMADLDIDDYLYSDDSLLSSKRSASNDDIPYEPRSLALKNAVSMEDVFRLTSIHRGKRLQSLSLDSIGTQKVVAIASYIIDALKNGKTLVVDELDSSLHFKLTRAIVALFNNELNAEAQLIFTAHDATLLDCRKLFRKDQIWFISKDAECEYLYSLAEFTALGDNVRSDTDLFNKYNSGVLGAIPEPDLFDILLDVNKRGEKADAK